MNNGIMIGCSKRFESHFNTVIIEMKHIVEDISGMFFLIASFNILQSPYNYKNKKNPYHLSETKIIEIIGQTIILEKISIYVFINTFYTQYFFWK